MTTKLDELKALMAAANVGELTVGGDKFGGKVNLKELNPAITIISQRPGMTVYIAYLAGDLNTNHKLAKAKIIAASVNALPALIAAVEALKLLHGNIAEYARINNLGGFDNQDMKIARAALAPFGENDEQKD